MKSYITVLVFFVFIKTTFSQQIEEKNNKREYFFSNSIGFTTINNENFKFQASTYTISAGMEFYLNQLISIIPEINIIKSNSNYSFEGVGDFVQLNTITLPISIRFITDRNTKMSLFGDAGLYGIKTTSFEVYNKGSKVKDLEFEDFNFGLHFQVGFKYKVYRNFNVKLLFKTATDILEANNAGRLNFENHNRLCLDFGFVF